MNPQKVFCEIKQNTCIYYFANKIEPFIIMNIEYISPQNHYLHQLSPPAIMVAWVAICQRPSLYIYYLLLQSCNCLCQEKGVTMPPRGSLNTHSILSESKCSVCIIPNYILIYDGKNTFNG